MPKHHMLILVGLTAIMPALSVNPAVAAGPAPTVVKVDMSDSSDDPAMKMMMMKADQQTIKSGPTIFDVTNDSKSLVHEMIVVAVKDASAPLPYDAKADRIIESQITHLGEASDLKPGTKKTLRLTLKPGTYLLLCNQRGHYHQGMFTTLTVTQ